MPHDESQRLKTLFTLDYPAYLASGHWRRLKTAKRAAQGDVCGRCRQAPWHELHHRNYLRIGCERLSDLVGLCRPCHRAVHKTTGPTQKVAATA